MRADWTASGARTSGSTAPPRGATRRASGGAATTNTSRFLKTPARVAPRRRRTREHSPLLPDIDEGDTRDIQRTSLNVPNVSPSNVSPPLFLCSLTHPQGPPRIRSGMFTAVQHYLPVDEHVLDAFAVLKWVGVGRAVDDALRVEDRDVGVLALTQDAAVEQAELGGVLRGHLADGVLQTQ